MRKLLSPAAQVEVVPQWMAYRDLLLQELFKMLYILQENGYQVQLNDTNIKIGYDTA